MSLRTSGTLEKPTTSVRILSVLRCTIMIFFIFWSLHLDNPRYVYKNEIFLSSSTFLHQIHQSIGHRYVLKINFRLQSKYSKKSIFVVRFFIHTVLQFFFFFMRFLLATPILKTWQIIIELLKNIIFMFSRKWKTH